VLPHDADYLLVALLGLLAALVGVGFKSVLYKVEDVCDRAWKGRPEWFRPAAGGIVLGAVLLALPQLYGVGYPVMDKAIAGQYVLWFVIILMLGKMLASSLTIGIGGSGGVFAPSLFTGAMAGTAFGIVANHLFGAAAGSPAIYGIIAMGAVFAAAAQAPLTSIASVIEMTGIYGLTLPVMLAVGLAAGLSKRMSYGTIYTTKLLRRGTDIERPRPASMLQLITVADVMQPLPDGAGSGELPLADRPVRNEGVDGCNKANSDWSHALGQIIETRRPQVLFGDETLEQALRQLALYGPEGLPVLAPDRRRIIGWITQQDVLAFMAERVAASAQEAAEGTRAAEWADPDKYAHGHRPPDPLDGYDVVELLITANSASRDRRVDEIVLPLGVMITAIAVGRRSFTPKSDTVLRAGDRLVLLTPEHEGRSDDDDATNAQTP
jgi:CIC family chloride channel protein